MVNDNNCCNAGVHPPRQKVEKQIGPTVPVNEKAQRLPQQVRMLTERERANVRLGEDIYDIMKHMLHVGLTGNIASGKSQVAAVFSELGAHVIDADAVAHELLTCGTRSYKKIVDAFGDQIVSASGAIDRRKLGEVVFREADKRVLLNRLIHPDVSAEILRRIMQFEETSSRGIIIVEAALLVETGSYRMYDRLVIVSCDPALQIARIKSRDGLTEAEAKSRTMAQMPIQEKLKFADYVIDTSRTLGQTHEQVEAIYRDLQVHELRVRQGRTS